MPNIAVPSRSATGDVVYMAQPLAREPVLAGFTYKIRWPSSDHAIYVTINDIEMSGPTGGAARRRPFEIFINSKNLEHYAWTVALTRMISAIFRRGGDVTFVVEELKAVFDPQGGQWMAGRYVPSLLAAIGEVIETHMRRTGFLSDPDRGQSLEEGAAPVRASGFAEAAQAPLAGLPSASAPRPSGRACPRCNNLTLARVEGCWVCDTCGYARCG
jgi:ribonucleoside-diphosphate reductase alpha chain